MTDIIEKLAPFICRARVAEAGRQRLAGLRNRLRFVLITTDIAPNSRQKMLELFTGCPVVQALEAADIERLFGFRNTKVIGFRRSTLAEALYRDLAEHRVLPETGNSPEPPLGSADQEQGDEMPA